MRKAQQQRWAQEPVYPILSTYYGSKYLWDTKLQERRIIERG